MFYHAYNGYLNYAYPKDELRPLVIFLLIFKNFRYLWVISDLFLRTVYAGSVICTKWADCLIFTPFSVQCIIQSGNNKEKIFCNVTKYTYINFCLHKLSARTDFYQTFFSRLSCTGQDTWGSYSLTLVFFNINFVKIIKI